MKHPQQPRHPLQPLALDDHGTLRFHPNAIVRHLLDHGGINLNDLARMEFSQEDWEQFAQLIGYSLSGFGELSYVRNETYEAAARMSYEAGTGETEARLAAAEEKLALVKETLRGLVPELFRIHPDDLVD